MMEHDEKSCELFDMSPPDLNRERAPMLDRTLYAMRAVGEWHIGLVLAFAGRTEAPRLAAALSHSLQAVPLLAGRLVTSRRAAHWEWPRQAPPLDCLTTAEGEWPEPGNHPFFLQPMDHGRGPQIQALLLRGATDTLCLKLSHYAADAGGVKEYAYLLAELYRRLADDPDYRPPELRFSRSMRQIGDLYPGRGKWRILRRLLAEVRANPRRPHPYVLPGKVAPAENRRFLVRHLEPPAFRALVDWAKPRGLTINDVLVAGLLRALTSLAADDAERVLRIIGTVDLRRYLPDKRIVIGNLSGWVYANFGTKRGDNLEETAALVGREMRRLKTGTLGLSQMPSLWLLNRCLPLSWEGGFYRAVMKIFTKNNSFAPSLTNMGPIDAARLAFEPPLRRAYLIVPLIFPPVFGAGISGFRDTLTLTGGFCASGTDPALIEELFDAWMGELPR